MRPRVLVVEDEEAISEPLAEHLAREGFDAEVTPTIERAREAWRRDTTLDLVLLDVMLPDGDGRDLCREIRRESDVPIIMLTARGEEIDRIVGLELGADDYVVKPFSAGELVARMRAIMRRGRATARKGPITVGSLVLDPAARTVTKQERPLELAAKEFDLLHMLMASAGEVLKREEIMDEVWDPHWFGPTKTLDVHISWLRKKIEDDPSKPRFITTVRGVGFRFAAPDEADESAAP
jgi:DNA-binding response OmpR family regulator